MALIEEAVEAGARRFKACEVLGISTRTFARWKQGKGRPDGRKGAPKEVPRKLSETERDEIVRVACSKEYCDQNPYEIIASHLEQGSYLASPSTFYRVLRSRNLVHHRSEAHARHSSSRPPELRATGPDQVWSWDITYMKTAVSGIFVYAYMIIDVWSRSIVGWEIHEREDPDLAAELFRRVALRRNVKGVRLHADNGNAMKAATMIMMFFQLGIIPSFSRPRVSDDNPYSESFFKTLKCNVRYPHHFDGIEHSRSWTADFVNWYNTEHRHSGIGYVTPQQRHDGLDLQIFERRNKTLDRAREIHPERWGKRIGHHGADRVVYLNPIPEKLSA
ncbi:MAG: IS3 family transposase [Deltaproteobacteria bacterium]